MEKYDVVIVGAGPSGTSCARSISDNSDKSVLILEANSSPLAQGGGATFTRRIRNLLPRLPGKVIDERVSKVTVKSANETANLRSDTDYPLVTILDRESFDSWLLEKAVDSGAVAKMGHRVIEVNDLEEGYEVVTEKENFKSEYVVGADGPPSNVGKMVGMKTSIPSNLMGVCSQYHIEKIEGFSDRIVFVFNTNYSDSGYSWIFPKEGGNKVGVGVPRTVGNPKDYLNKFLEEQISYDGKIECEEGGLVPVSKPLNSGYKGKVALVGDALRVVDPLIGAGVCNAIVTGQELGKVIAKGEPLSLYDERWKENLLRGLEDRHVFREVMSSWDDDGFDRFVKAIKGYTFSSSDTEEQNRGLLKHILVKDPLLGLKIGFREVFNRLL